MGDNQKSRPERMLDAGQVSYSVTTVTLATAFATGFSSLVATT
jgi:hypothetical protein